eukprot:2909185-Amphidinium_carterae.4
MFDGLYNYVDCTKDFESWCYDWYDDFKQENMVDASIPRTLKTPRPAMERERYERKQNTIKKRKVIDRLTRSRTYEQIHIDRQLATTTSNYYEDKTTTMRTSSFKLKQTDNRNIQKQRWMQYEDKDPSQRLYYQNDILPYQHHSPAVILDLNVEGPDNMKELCVFATVIFTRVRDRNDVYSSESHPVAIRRDTLSTTTSWRRTSSSQLLLRKLRGEEVDWDAYRQARSQ